VAGGAVVAHHVYKKHQAKKHAAAGQFCSPKKAKIYKKKHLKCSGGHLVHA